MHHRTQQTTQHPLGFGSAWMVLIVLGGLCRLALLYSPSLPHVLAGAWPDGDRVTHTPVSAEMVPDPLTNPMIDPLTDPAHEATAERVLFIEQHEPFRTGSS